MASRIACSEAAVEGFIEAGRWLIEAKDDLQHGEFEKMVQDDLQMSPRTGRRFMEIARHPVISNRTLLSDLPPAWGALYELTKVEPAVLKAAIKDGRVNPKMERKEVAARRPVRGRRDRNLTWMRRDPLAQSG